MLTNLVKRIINVFSNNRTHRVDKLEELNNTISTNNTKHDNRFMELNDSMNTLRITLVEQLDKQNKAITDNANKLDQLNNALVPVQTCAEKQNYYQIFTNNNSEEKLCLMAINDEVRDKILLKLKENVNTSGCYINNGGKLAQNYIPALLAGAVGALKMSSVASGTIFMATANPTTLMTIGSGVGSAVMGTTGIVAQAAFIPVAGATIAVAAPVVVFQALSAIMILHKLDKVNKQLLRVESKLDRLLQIKHAEQKGAVLAILNKVESLEKELFINKWFTLEMTIRLSLAEDTVCKLIEEINILHDSVLLDTMAKEEDIFYKQDMAFLMLILTELDFRLNILRIKLALQDNPFLVKDRVDQLNDKIERYKKISKEIQNHPNKITKVAQEVSKSINEMNRWQKNMPALLLGKRGERKEKEEKVKSLKYYIRDDKTKLMSQYTESIDSVTGSNLADQTMTFLYWKDEEGEHSYYTDDLRICENII